LKKIKVKAPATVSNVGSGFDIMGFAFDGAGDILELSLRDDEEIHISNQTTCSLPEMAADNVVFPALKAMQDQLKSRQGANISFIQKINPGSGIGSSAASSVAAVFAYNELQGRPFDPEELIVFAMEGEKMVSGAAHADNVAPCMLGGFTLIRSYKPLDIVKVPFPGDLFCTVVHPHISITTRESRAALKETTSLHDTVTQAGNAAGLITGLITGDFDLIGRSMVDVIAEPRRKKLIPGYDMVKKSAIDSGVIGVNISGSGPSVFALSTSTQTANKAGMLMQKKFLEHGLTCSVYISGIANKGVSIIQE